MEYVAPYIVPPLRETIGAFVNPLPEDAVSYVSQDSTKVTIRVTQLWSTEALHWISGYYDDGDSVICPKTRNVAPGANIDYEVWCGRDGVGVFSFGVNDDSLTSGWGFELPSDCEEAEDDIMNKVVWYVFDVQCNPPPLECDDEVDIT